jgi:hypothetical protein
MKYFTGDAHKITPHSKSCFPGRPRVARIEFEAGFKHIRNRRRFQYGESNYEKSGAFLVGNVGGSADIRFGSGRLQTFVGQR